MNNERDNLIIYFWILVIFCVVGFMVIQSGTDTQRIRCRTYCSEIGGEFKHFTYGNRSPDQCICKVNGEIKNLY